MVAVRLSSGSSSGTSPQPHPGLVTTAAIRLLLKVKRDAQGLFLIWALL